MDSHDGWRLQPVAEPVSYFDSRACAFMSSCWAGAVELPSLRNLKAGDSRVCDPARRDEAVLQRRLAPLPVGVAGSLPSAASAHELELASAMACPPSPGNGGL